MGYCDERNDNRRRRCSPEETPDTQQEELASHPRLRKARLPVGRGSRYKRAKGRHTKERTTCQSRKRTTENVSERPGYGRGTTARRRRRERRGSTSAPSLHPSVLLTPSGAATMASGVRGSMAQSARGQCITIMNINQSTIAYVDV